ncbi:MULTISPECIES: hypothetical protein [unclassified Lysinibacillus]|nr:MULTISPECIES: hypothetical protein [unclassified Lysinibacillus]MDM5246915.1 hypothetical protein [Lysinibacillus sp. G4S2]
MPWHNSSGTALCLHKELLSDSMTSAGGFNFFQQAFGHLLKEVKTPFFF